MTAKFKGIAASDGIAIARAYLFISPDLSFEKKRIEANQYLDEVQRLEDALIIAKNDIRDIKDSAAERLGEEEALVFDAHLMLLNDPDFVGGIFKVIEEELVIAETALTRVANEYIHTFEKLEDNLYMQERAGDIRDVSQRVLAYLLNVKIPNLSNINEEVIVVAQDLVPSDTAQLNQRFVKGFATDVGGRTSHTAIIARSLGIPAVVGLKELSQNVEDGMMVIIDGLEGQIILDPSSEEIAFYQEKQAAFRQQKKVWAQLKDHPSFSKDGHQVEIVANIGSPDDLDMVLENGAEGIGLFRTEFLYMQSKNYPSEEAQYLAYKKVLEGMDSKPVVIRTMDIGGDKHLPYMPLPEEMNPFLGYRAIRLSLDRKDLFITQLRALLRASVYGKLRIMFPMVATLEEFRHAKAIYLEAKEQLINEGYSVSDDIELGIMVEVPASAVIADYLAKEVDFFSIGTNDLIQYTMAADRMNERISYLYQPYHPAVLRLINHVIKAAHNEGKWVGMCGEMAGDPLAIPLLLGMELDEFSMAPSSILQTRTAISHLELAETKDLAEQALTQCQTNEEVKKLVDFFLRSKKKQIIE